MNHTQRFHARKLTALAVVSVLVAAVIAVFAPTPAHAHGGPLSILASHNGSGAIVAVLVYKRDNHIFEAPADLEVLATSSGGEALEPVHMSASQLGGGVWETPTGFLADGDWQIEVRMTKPQLVSVTIDAAVGAAASGESTIMSPDELLAAAPDEPVETSAAPSSSMLPVVGVVVVGALLIGLFVLLIIRRQRARAARS